MVVVLRISLARACLCERTCIWHRPGAGRVVEVSYTRSKTEQVTPFHDTRVRIDLAMERSAMPNLTLHRSVWHRLFSSTTHTMRLVPWKVMADSTLFTLEIAALDEEICCCCFSAF